MSDPMRVQEDTLAALDRQIQIAKRFGDSGSWTSYLEGGDDGYAIESDDGGKIGFIVGPQLVAEFIAANDPTTTLAVLEGRRRIIERHAPVESVLAPGSWYCAHHGLGRVFPCPDWRDASAGLLPEPPS
jgi:hypothetical protein